MRRFIKTKHLKQTTKPVKNVLWIILFAALFPIASCSLLNLEKGLEADRCNPELEDPCGELNEQIPSADPCLNWQCNADRYCELLTRDMDGDGFVDATCDPQSSRKDCDDSNADRYPGNRESCDLIDNDCDDTVDENALISAAPVALSEFNEVLRFAGLSTLPDEIATTHIQNQVLGGVWIPSLSNGMEMPVEPEDPLSAWDCGSALSPIENDGFISGFISTWVSRVDTEEMAQEAAISQAIVIQSDQVDFITNSLPEDGVFLKSEECTQPHLPNLSVLNDSQAQSAFVLTSYLCEHENVPQQIPQLCQPELDAESACERDGDSRKVAISFSEIQNLRTANPVISFEQESPLILGTTNDVSPPSILPIEEKGWIVAFSTAEEGIVVYAIPKVFDEEVPRQDQIQKVWTQVERPSGHVELTLGPQTDTVEERNQTIALTYRGGCLTNHSVNFQLLSIEWNAQQSQIEALQNFTFSPGASERVISPTSVWMADHNRWLLFWLSRNQNLKWTQLSPMAEQIGGLTQSAWQAGEDQPLGLSMVPLSSRYNPNSTTVDLFSLFFQSRQTQMLGVRFSCQ